MKVSDMQSPSNCVQRSKSLRQVCASALIAIALAIVIPATNGYAGEETPVVTIHARRYEFVPAEISLTAGKPVKLVFIADDVGHGISIEGLLSDLNFDPGDPASVVITPSQAGDFNGECSRYYGAGHATMKFLVHVLN